MTEYNTQLVRDKLLHTSPTPRQIYGLLQEALAEIDRLHAEKVVAEVDTNLSAWRSCWSPEPYEGDELLKKVLEASNLSELITVLTRVKAYVEEMDSIWLA